MPAALLLMDYQVAICGPGGRLGSSSGLSAHIEERGVLARVASCLATARLHGIPVVHTRVAFDPGYTTRTNRSSRFTAMERNRLLLEGSPDVEFLAPAAPIDGEAVVTKGCVNPFIGTNLEQRLVALGARELFLAGVATNFVVESAARHAGDSGFAVTVLEDLCGAYSHEMHDFAIINTLPLFATISSFAEFERGVAAGEIVGASEGWASSSKGT